MVSAGVTFDTRLRVANGNNTKRHGMCGDSFRSWYTKWYTECIAPVNLVNRAQYSFYIDLKTEMSTRFPPYIEVAPPLRKAGRNARKNSA